MIEEDLIKSLNGDKKAAKILEEYLNQIINSFFDKYIKKYPKLESVKEYAMEDAGWFVINRMTKFKHLWEGKGNYDKMARYLIVYYYFAK